jgi:hypothetical protein
MPGYLCCVRIQGSLKAQIDLGDGYALRPAD